MAQTMTVKNVDILASLDIVELMWKEIDSLACRGYYEEAYRYLRIVTADLNTLHEARLGICSFLENRADTGVSLQTLQSLVIKHIEPVKEHGKLLYLESLGAIMQATLQALYYDIDMSKLQANIIEWCIAHCNQFESNITYFIAPNSANMFRFPSPPPDAH